MNLSIGCGRKKHPNTTHIDISPDVGADVVWDLNNTPWPFNDGAFDKVFAIDIIEHLDSVVGTVEECHRVLSDGGVLEIRTPDHRSENSWVDPTHKWHLASESFDYFDPETLYGDRYSYYSKGKFKIAKKEKITDNLVFELVKR